MNKKRKILKKIAYFSPIAVAISLNLTGMACSTTGLVKEKHVLDDFEGTTQYKNAYILEKNALDDKFASGEIGFSEYKSRNERLDSNDFTKRVMEDNAYYFGIYKSAQRLYTISYVFNGASLSAWIGSIFWIRSNKAKDIKADIALDKEAKRTERENKKLEKMSKKMANKTGNKVVSWKSQNKDEFDEEPEEHFEDINDYLSRYQ